MSNREITTTIDGIDLVVQYHFIGSFKPATHLEPEEYMELEIIDVNLTDSEIDIYELLSKKQVETIEAAIWANE